VSSCLTISGFDMINYLCSLFPKARVTASSPWTFPRRMVPFDFNTRSFSSGREGEWSELSFCHDLSFFTRVQTESPRLATVSMPDCTNARMQQLPSESSSKFAISINSWSTDSNTTIEMVSYAFLEDKNVKVIQSPRAEASSIRAQLLEAWLV
jgi:hypothetical protein